MGEVRRECVHGPPAGRAMISSLSGGRPHAIRRSARSCARGAIRWTSRARPVSSRTRGACVRAGRPRRSRGPRSGANRRKPASRRSARLAADPMEIRRKSGIRGAAAFPAPPPPERSLVVGQRLARSPVVCAHQSSGRPTPLTAKRQQRSEGSCSGVGRGSRDEDRRLAPALAVDLAALGQDHATDSGLNAPRAVSEGRISGR
jgi:hypothetical protein